jgi:hypothetical protein
MRSKRLITAIACLLLTGLLPGQNRTCGTSPPPAAWDAWFNGLVSQRQLQQEAARESQVTFTIPVIVHVIHSGEGYNVYPNISREQIQSQINILNADFAGTGYNSAGIPSAFAAHKANCNIVFSMAMVDPQGKALPEPGIERIDWRLLGLNCNPYRPSSSSAFQVFFDDSIKPVTIWDPARYFNVWLSDRRSTLDLLGYATFPANSTLNGIFNGNGQATNDGVWIWPKAFGNQGILDPTYNKGRTATHEIGHWLGLRHIWGDSGCGDDFCGDTPIQQTSNFNCPTFPKTSCSNGPSGDMFMNFMDYSDDGCLSMFTWDQRARMQTAMSNADFRKHLTTSASTVCNLPSQSPTAVFTVTDAACMNTVVLVTNQSTGMPGPYYTWNIEPNQGFTIKMPYATMDPTLAFSVGGQYSITLVATNSSGSNSVTKVINLIDCGFVEGIGEVNAFTGTAVYPNPGTGLFSVQGAFEDGIETRVEVFSVAGIRVSSATMPYQQGLTVDLTSLEDGVYFARVSQRGVLGVARLVLMR